MKEKTGEKCTQKKKKKVGTKKIGQVRRKSLAGNFFLDKVRVNFCCTGQCGIFKWDLFFFFPYIYSSNWRDCNFMSQVRKPLDPNFPSHFFSLTKYTKILFSLLFYFFPSFLKSIQPNKLVLKSHPFLSINGILE